MLLSLSTNSVRLIFHCACMADKMLCGKVLLTCLFQLYSFPYGEMECEPSLWRPKHFLDMFIQESIYIEVYATPRVAFCLPCLNSHHISLFKLFVAKTKE